VKTPKGAGIQRVFLTQEARYGMRTGCLRMKPIYLIKDTYCCARCRWKLLPKQSKKRKKDVRV
jgi:hypothetical protein